MRTVQSYMWLFMDGKKAFDAVWYGGLMYILVNECNLDTTTIMYTGMTSAYVTKVNYLDGSL